MQNLTENIGRKFGFTALNCFVVEDSEEAFQYEHLSSFVKFSDKKGELENVLQHHAHPIRGDINLSYFRQSNLLQSAIQTIVKNRIGYSDFGSEISGSGCPNGMPAILAGNAPDVFYGGGLYALLKGHEILIKRGINENPFEELIGLYKKGLVPIGVYNEKELIVWHPAVRVGELSTETRL